MDYSIEANENMRKQKEEETNKLNQIIKKNLSERQLKKEELIQNIKNMKYKKIKKNSSSNSSFQTQNITRFHTQQNFFTENSERKKLKNPQSSVFQAALQVKNIQNLMKTNKRKSLIKREQEKVWQTLDNRKKTITKFCFKQAEKDEDAFLAPVIKKITDGDLQGSMTVSELWSDKNMKKYLAYANMSDGKYALRSISKAAQQAQNARQGTYIFTNKHEQLLKSQFQIQGIDSKKMIATQFLDNQKFVNLQQTDLYKQYMQNNQINFQYIKHFLEKSTMETEQYKKHTKSNSVNIIKTNSNEDCECPICGLFLQQDDILGNPGFLQLENHKKCENCIFHDYIEEEKEKEMLENVKNEMQKKAVQEQLLQKKQQNKQLFKNSSTLFIGNTNNNDNEQINSNQRMESSLQVIQQQKYQYIFLKKIKLIFQIITEKSVESSQKDLNSISQVKSQYFQNQNQEQDDFEGQDDDNHENLQSKIKFIRQNRSQMSQTSVFSKPKYRNSIKKQSVVLKPSIKISSIYDKYNKNGQQKYQEIAYSNQMLDQNEDDGIFQSVSTRNIQYDDDQIQNDNNINKQNKKISNLNSESKIKSTSEINSPLNSQNNQQNKQKYFLKKQNVNQVYDQKQNFNHTTSNMNGQYSTQIQSPQSVRRQLMEQSKKSLQSPTKINLLRQQTQNKSKTMISNKIEEHFNTITSQCGSSTISTNRKFVTSNNMYTYDSTKRHHNQKPNYQKKSYKISNFLTNKNSLFDINNESPIKSPMKSQYSKQKFSTQSSMVNLKTLVSNQQQDNQKNREPLYNPHKQRLEKSQKLNQSLKQKFDQLDVVMNKIDKVQDDSKALKKNISNKISRLENLLIKQELEFKQDKRFQKQMKKDQNH